MKKLLSLLLALTLCVSSLARTAALAADEPAPDPDPIVTVDPKDPDDPEKPKEPVPPANVETPKPSGDSTDD